MKLSALASPKERLRDWLTPARASVDVHGVQHLVDAATTLLAEANELRVRGRRVPALLTYREAFRQLARARERVHDTSSESDKLVTLFERPAELEALLTLDPAAPPDAAESKKLLGACLEASRRLDLFLVKDLRYTRGRMRLERLLLLLGAALGVAVFGVREASGAHNLTRGQVFTATSARFGSPLGLNNGAIEWGGFAIQTQVGAREAVSADLGAEHTLQEVRLYGRGDGYFTFGLPLRVELSNDGKVFHAAGKACTGTFTQASPCSVSLNGERARHVRIAGSAVCLSEVEILGTR